MKDDGYKIRDQKAIHFLTLTVVNWIDVFTRQVYRDIIIKNLEFCRKNKGLHIHAYVIMSNHIHLVVSSDTAPLSNIIRDFKSFTAKEIIKVISESPESRKDWILHQFSYFGKINPRNETYQFWVQDNHPEELISNQFIDQKIEYIHQNPVRAGIVDEPEDYIYSSARNYAGLKGLIEVDII